MREEELIIVGASATGIACALAAQRAGARPLILDKGAVPVDVPPGLRVLSGAMVLDIIPGARGDVTGVLFADADARETRVARTGAIIVATGGASGLLSDAAEPEAVGDGLVLATRAGAAVEGPRLEEDEHGIHLAGGVVCDRDGRTSVEGLFVAGDLAARHVDADAVGAAAAGAAAGPLPDLGAFAHRSTIDTPLPKGFLDVKFQRLRDVMDAHYHPRRVDMPRANLLIRQLKGEGNEYARARVDIDVLSFEMACEAAAILLAAAIQGQ